MLKRQGKITPIIGKKFVAYYRVSTAQQGASGLGLEAQREAVSRHVAGAGGVIVAEFQEVESGKKNDRPQIAAALAACRCAARRWSSPSSTGWRATSIHLVADGVGRRFRRLRQPACDRLTIHVLAAVAEHEREMISARTIAAMAAAKARGVKLGNPNLRPGSRRAAQVARHARSEIADAHAADVLPYIARARKAGCASFGELARALSACGIRTPAGGLEWHAYQVARILAAPPRTSAGIIDFAPIVKLKRNA